MGAKKKADKKPSKGDDDGDNPEMMFKLMTAEIANLRQKIVMEQERNDKALTREALVVQNKR